MSSLVLLNVLADSCDGLVIGLVARFLTLDDESLGSFTRAVVVDLDDGAVGDEWMGQEMSLQLSRCDLVALHRVS